MRRSSGLGIMLVGVVILMTGLLAIPGIGFYTLPTIPLGTTRLASTNIASPSSPVWFKHTVILMMENQGISTICPGNTPPCSTSGPAPYLAGLANNYAMANQYTSVFTPLTSLPNYIGTIAGSTFNCNSGGCGTGAGTLTQQNIIDRLTSGGLTWRAYMEQYPRPSGCGADYGIQPYDIGHNPFIWFSDIYNNVTRCTQIVDANPTSCPTGPGGFNTDCILTQDLNSPNAPNYAWLSPNNCNNMHAASPCTNGCAVAGPTCIQAGNAYLASIVPGILGSSAFTSGQGALFIVFDEGTGYCPINGSSEDCVLMVTAGTQAKTNTVTSNLLSHYGLLRTIEDNWGLPYLQIGDQTATNLAAMLQTINAPPPGPLQIAYTYAPLQPVINSPIVFTATATGGIIPYTFSWKFINSGGVLIGTANGQTTTFTFANAGSYNVQATVVDSETPPFSTTIGATVTVVAPVVQLQSGFTFGPNDAPFGTTVKFNGTSTGGVPPYTFTWEFGDGGVATAQSVSYNYANPGTYNVVLTVTDSESTPASSSTSQSITVTQPVSNGPPAAAINVFPTIGIVNQQMTFTATVTGGTPPYTYSWSLCGFATGQTNPFGYTFGQPTTCVITLTVTDSASKQTSVSQTITVQQPVAQSSNTGLPLWVILVIAGTIVTVVPVGLIRRKHS